VAERLVNDGGVVSVQVLNELVNALNRKFGFGCPGFVTSSTAILMTCPNPLPLTLETPPRWIAHLRALWILSV